VKGGDGEMIEDSALERDETSEQTDGPSDCARKDEVPERRQKTRKDDREIDSQLRFPESYGRLWEKVENFEIWCRAKGAEKYGQLSKSRGIVEFLDSVNEIEYRYETEEVMMVDENCEKLTTGASQNHVEERSTYLTGVNGGPEGCITESSATPPSADVSEREQRLDAIRPNGELENLAEDFWGSDQFDLVTDTTVGVVSKSSTRDGRSAYIVPFGGLRGRHGGRRKRTTGRSLVFYGEVTGPPNQPRLCSMALLLSSFGF